jgi:hypothetical protein
MIPEAAGRAQGRRRYYLTVVAPQSFLAQPVSLVVVVVVGHMGKKGLKGRHCAAWHQGYAPTGQCHQ